MPIKTVGFTFRTTDGARNVNSIVFRSADGPLTIHKVQPVLALILDPVLALSVRSREGHLRLSQRVAHRVDQKTGPVNAPESLVGFLLGEAVQHHHTIPDLLGNTHTGTAGSVNDDPLILQSTASDVDGRKQSSQSDSTSTFDVIVEARDLGLVLVEQPLRIAEAEIFKVNEGVGEQLAALLDELVDKLVVQLSPDSSSFPTQVQGVGELHVVVGSRVKHDWQDSVGLDTGTQGVERGFGEGDGDTTNTLIYRRRLSSDSF